jgi:predicted solute-binding protein
MLNAREDLWPTNFPDPVDPAPVALLKEQALLLGGKTNGEIEGVVRMIIEDEIAYHIMYLKASRVEIMVAVMMISYSTFKNIDDVYPISVAPPGDGGAGYGPKMTIANDQEFRSWLRDQLASKPMLSRISVLKNYIREHLAVSASLAS